MTAKHGRVLCCGLLLSAVAFVAAEPKKLLTVAERKEMSAILAEFRKLKPEADERLDLVDKLAALGPPAVDAAKAVAEKELQKSLAEYTQQFSAATAKAYSTRITKNNAAEVTALRDNVAQLQKKENLTKEDIVSVADPALARLKEIFLVDREQVFEISPPVKERRERLLQQGRVWFHCQKLLQEAAAAELPEEAKSASVAPAAESFADYLQQEEELCIFRVMPIDDAAKQVTAYNNQLGSQLDAQEFRCIQQANLMRVLLGLKALKIDPKLCAACRAHSTDMKKLNFFSHESPVPGRKSFTDRAQLAGTSASGENIAVGTQDGGGANMMWWHSPGHHKNMLGGHDRIGVGRAEAHWTEMFGG